MVNALFWMRKLGRGTILWRYYISTKITLKNLQLGFKVTFKNMCCLNIWYPMEFMTSGALHCEKNIWHDVTILPGWDVSTMETSHRVHWSINPPSKRRPPLFRQDPLKPANCLYSPLLGNTAISCIFRDPIPP